MIATRQQVWVTAATGFAAVVFGVVCSGALRQASATPERVILCAAADPAHEAAVAWRCSPPSATGSAQIVASSGRTDFGSSAKSVPATATPLDLKEGDATHFSVQFRELRPETVYAYRVANGPAWSEWFQFRTASTRPKPFSFLYFGDEQTDLASRTPRVIRQALADASDARLMLHAGDLTNVASADNEWGEWFRLAGFQNGSIMNVPAVGNHQYEKIDPKKDERSLTRHWRAQFALPENGVPGLEESCYYLDYQGVRFVVLNSMEKLVEQSRWLERILSRNPCRWTVALFHHPFYSGAKNRDNKEVREQWKPLFDRFGVDLVLAGHDHVYGRSNPKAGPAAGRTIYVLSVACTKQYDAGDHAWAARFGQDIQLYQVISIDGGRLTYRAHTADGVLYDGFELRKQGGRSTFSETRGLGPESLRPAK